MPGYLLIDPPVGPFSAPDEIEAWIARLKQMEDCPEVRDALYQAEQDLKDAREIRSRSGRK